jgi:phage/plasmid-associated DNA primase
VGTFDGNNFAYRNTSADSASQNRWLMILKNKRIVFSNEIKSTIPLNGNLIKMVSSGGDCLVGRNHCGNETEFYISFLCVLFANDLPKIMPYDDAVNNRVRVISYTKPYVENPNEYELKIDPNIDAEFDTLDFQRCFLELLIRQYWLGIQGFYKEEPEEVLQAKENWIDCEVGCIPSFLQEFEITDDVNDYVLSSDIQSWLEYGKLGITMKKFGMELRQYCLTKKLTNVDVIKKKINGKSIRAWIGIKFISFNCEK